MAKNISTFEFKVETKEAGQRRRYGDSYYNYVVESKHDIPMIEAFCTKVLKPAIPAEQYTKENNCADNHFRNYYTMFEVVHQKEFLSDELNKVEYMVVSPSTH